MGWGPFRQMAPSHPAGRSQWGHLVLNHCPLQGISATSGLPNVLLKEKTTCSFHKEETGQMPSCTHPEGIQSHAQGGSTLDSVGEGPLPGPIRRVGACVSCRLALDMGALGGF